MGTTTIGLRPLSAAGPGGFLREEGGGVLVFVALALPVFLMIAALVFDIGLARLHHTRLQIAADAAALAAARHPGDIDAARGAAQTLAGQNYPGSLRSADVTFVHWDEVAGTAGPPDPANDRAANAVSVTTRRDAGSNGLLPHVFGGAVAGLSGDGFTLAAESIALLAAETGCSSGTGIFADGRLDLGGGSEYFGVCLYGRQAVGVGQGVALDDATAVIAPDLDRIDEPARGSHGVAATLDLVLPARVPGQVAAAGNATEPPDTAADLYPSDTVVGRRDNGTQHAPTGQRPHLCSDGISNRPCAANDPFTHHVWNRSGNGTFNVTLRNNTTYRNLIVETDGTITLGQGVTLENVTLWAGRDIVFGNNASLDGVRVFAARDVTIGANNVAVGNTTIWAGGDITVLSQSSTFSDLTLRSGGAVQLAGRGNDSGGTTFTRLTAYAAGDLLIDGNVAVSGARIFGNGLVTVADSPNGNRSIVLGNAAGACPSVPGGFDSYVLALGAVNIGDNARVFATQIGTATSLTLGLEVSFLGSAAEAETRADVGAGSRVTGCPATSDFGQVDTTEVSGAAGGGRAVLVR